MVNGSPSPQAAPQRRAASRASPPSSGTATPAASRASQRLSACPLCDSGDHELIETLSYESIRYVYRRLLGIEIAAEPWSRLEYLRCAACDLRFFSPQVCGDPGFYERLQAFPWYYLEEKSEYRLAGRLIPAGSSVLEVGCGSGVFSTFLPAGCRYRGLEYNDEAVRKARQRGLTVDRGSIEELAESAGLAACAVPSESAERMGLNESAECARPSEAAECGAPTEPVESSFDVVCGFQVLEHVASPAAFLASAARLLRPGGLLIVAVPSEDSLMAEEVNNVLNTPPHHLTRWTDAALENAARIIGLKLTHLEHERVSDLHLRPRALRE